MAHVKRRNNKWQISVEKGINPLTGERERIYKTIPNSKNMTKTEAKKEMSKLVVELEYGTYIEPENMTLAEFLLMWLEDECEPNLAPRSFASYEMIIKKHIIPAIGIIPLQKLQPMHIKTYQSKKLKDGRLDNKSGGLSNKTVRMHMHILSQALKYAVSLQILKSNPCEHVKAPKKKKSKVNYLEKDELNTLLKHIKDSGKEWDYLFFVLAAHTGMRRGELLGLQWNNIDFVNKKIYVRNTLQRIRNHGLILKECPKTKSSQRNIDISLKLINLLKKHKEYVEKHSQYKEEYKENNLIFCNKDGSFVNPNSITRRFNKYLSKAGVKKIRLHDLRHTHASLLLKAGIQPKVVQERLGHSSIATTMDTYSHLSPSLQKEAAKELDKLINI